MTTRGLARLESIHSLLCPSPRARSAGMGARPVRPTRRSIRAPDRRGPLDGARANLSSGCRARIPNAALLNADDLSARVAEPLSRDARGAPVARHASDPVLELRAGNRRSRWTRGIDRYMAFNRGRHLAYAAAWTAPGGESARVGDGVGGRHQRTRSRHRLPGLDRRRQRRSRIPGRSPRGGTRGGMGPGRPASRAASLHHARRPPRAPPRRHRQHRRRGLAARWRRDRAQIDEAPDQHGGRSSRSTGIDQRAGAPARTADGRAHLRGRPGGRRARRVGDRGPRRRSRPDRDRASRASAGPSCWSKSKVWPRWRTSWDES